MAWVKKRRSFIRRICAKKFLYLGQERYIVCASKGIEAVSQVSKEKTRVVVLGKEYYFETVRTFSFSNLTDIKSAIRTDMGAYSPFETDLFFVKKIQGEDDRAKVNIWFVFPDIAKMLADLSPLLVIPETALLSLMPDSEAVLYVVNLDPERKVFVCIGKDGTVRSILTRSGNLDLISFKRSMGHDATDFPVMEITDAEKYRQLLCDTFSAVPIRRLSSFLNLDSFFSNFRWASLRHGLSVSLSLFFIYLCLSFLFPYYTAERLLNEDKHLSASLSGLLKKQEMIDDFEKREKILAGKINAYTCKMAIIKAINDVLPAGVTIRQLTVSGNRVVIMGTAPKASEVLAALGKRKDIRNASFSSPLREDRKSGMEIFAVTFIYEREGDRGRR